MSLERFEWLRNASDEVPDEIIHGRGHLKVRRNWWNSLVGDLERGLKKGVVPEELRDEVEGFIDHYASEEFHHQPLTTETDIQRANGLLDRILGRKQG